MTATAVLAIDLTVVVLLIVCLALFRSPRTAKVGNVVAMAALAIAIGSVFLRGSVNRGAVVAVALLVGAVVGLALALRVTMIQIPAMVAFQHGAGGLAALLVSLLEVWRGTSADMGAFQVAAGLVGMVIGAATFTASLVASGKLAGVLGSKPTQLRGHTAWTMGLLLAAAAAAAAAPLTGGSTLLVLLIVASAVACVAGIVLAVRIGGADMPVLISFLNATAGFAAAFCGVTIGSRLLVVCGATVAASGSVLTHVMCQSMNRRLATVLVGTASGASAPPAAPAVAGSATPEPATTPAEADPYVRAAQLLRDAQRVVIIPGYGMALAQAQFEVVSLARRLEEMGKDVKFAIHPVAGRMPGHMHVLLAEADVSYDKLYEMNQINEEFKETDVAIVIGACDVVNTAAMSVENCPISGMPILRAHEAKHILVCNFDEQPGYSGVDNPLYQDPKTTMLLGDAKATVGRLLEELRSAAAPAVAGSATPEPATTPAEAAEAGCDAHV